MCLQITRKYFRNAIYYFSTVIKSCKVTITVITTFQHYIYTRPTTCFFYKQCVFSTKPQCCLTVSWIEPGMLLRCCLIHISMIILRHVLYLLCLCPRLDLGLFMSYLCDSFLIFIFIFIMINRIILWTQIHLFFCLFFRIYPIFLGDNYGWRMWIIFK